MTVPKQPAPLPLQTLRRLPNYYNYLRALKDQGTLFVSAGAIAAELGLNEVQVRKDLAAASQSPGKPRVGFGVEALLRDIGECLGYNNRQDAVLVGAGQLGTALLAYKGFADHGLCIAAAFDNNPQVVGRNVAGKKVLPIEKLPSLCSRMGIHIGIITVPAAQAQPVCNLMVEAGILAIWNFAPAHLRVPAQVLVQNENMAASLALLSQHLGARLRQQGKEGTP